MKYRADIDGLRAIAVLAVVFYHARIPGFSGGYVGVDVFFVISGFLITSILVAAYENDSYSIVEFYDRRIRRIIPALIPVYLFSLVMAAMLFPPSVMASFGQSLLSSGVFISNIIFYGEDGYFAAPSHEKPLLHTWSLSVEEQFYIVWPLILIGLLRFCSHRLKIVLTAFLAILSLGMAEWWLGGDPSAAFFLFPARAWELLIGCSIALFLTDRRPGIHVASWISVSGLTLIAIAIYYFDDTSRFPGRYALLPCLGAGLLIYGGQNETSWPNRFLASTGLVSIGLLSYSLYLWHWPILAFGRYYLDRALEIPEALACIGASLLLAYFSLRFVERPFRVSPKSSFESRRVIAFGVLTLVVVALTGFNIERRGGWPGRVPEALVAIDRYANEPSPLESACHGSPENTATNPKCVFGGAGGKHDVDVLLIGDSHGNHFSPVLQHLAARDGYTAQTMTTNSCLPLFGIWQYRKQRRLTGCTEYMAAVWRILSQSPRPLTVIIAARWSIHMQGFGLGASQPPVWFISEKGSNIRTPQNSRRVFGEALIATIKKITLLGHKVMLVGQVPEFVSDPQVCIGKEIMLGRNPDAKSCLIERKIVDAHFEGSKNILATVASRFKSAQFIDPLLKMCDASFCSPMLGDVIAYRDGNHLNPRGAQLIGDYFPVLNSGKGP